MLNVSINWHRFNGAANIEARAAVVSSENSIGRFDILPEHANFISVIYNSLSLKTEDKTEVYFFTRGLVEVSDNVVKIFLEGKID